MYAKHMNMKKGTLLMRHCSRFRFSKHYLIPVQTAQPNNTQLCCPQIKTKKYCVIAAEADVAYKPPTYFATLALPIHSAWMAVSKPGRINSSITYFLCICRHKPIFY